MSGSGQSAHDVPPGEEPIGSVAQEAFKLFRAMAPPHSSTDDARDADGHVCSTSWCPVCRVVGVVRDHPEAVASVAASATVFARSLRDLIDTALAPQEEQ